MRRSEHSDSQLVARSLAGDAGAFTALIDRYADALTSIACLKLRHADDARDVVQQAIFVAYTTLPSLADAARFGPWVKGIVTNLSHKLIDQRQRERAFLDRHVQMTPGPASGPDPGDVAVDHDRARRLDEALAGLDEVHRQVVVLRYLHDMKVDAVAELVSRPVGTVKRILSEARDTLRRELIGMAQAEFSEYQLTEEQRRRLAMIPTFPRQEPKITATPLAERASRTRVQTPFGDFAALKADAEACYADYDHPGRELTGITHVTVKTDVPVQGQPAMHFDNMTFSGEGKLEGVWRPYYRLVGDAVVFCAMQWGSSDAGLPLITPGHPDWKDPQPKPVSLWFEPGEQFGPDEDGCGFAVDTNLWAVRIGRRRFRCLRRVEGFAPVKVAWSDEPVTSAAAEQFHLPDGRLLLWRRYNGAQYSKRNPVRDSNAPGTYERLAEAGLPMIAVFGFDYYLWYDQIPDYALGQTG